MLPFESIKNQIETGDVLAFRGTAPHSRVIECFTCSVYSHAALAFWVKVGKTEILCAFESMEGLGVRLVPLDFYLADCDKSGIVVDWYQLVDPKVDREKITEYCLTQWGKRYSSPLQFIWSFGWITSRVRKWLGKKSAVNEDRPFCSWLDAAAFRYAGYDAEDLDPATTSPGEVTLLPCLRRMGSLQLNPLTVSPRST